MFFLSEFGHYNFTHTMEDPGIISLLIRKDSKRKHLNQDDGSHFCWGLGGSN